MARSDGEGLPDFFSRQVREARRFYLDLAPSPSGPLAVVCGGYEVCTPDYEIARDSFPYFSIEFVSGGRGWLRLGGKRQRLTPGTVFTYGPGISQHITTDSREPLAKYFVDFAGQPAMPLLAEPQLAPGTIHRVASPGVVQAVFDLLVQDGSQGSGYTGALCAALLNYLILKITDSRLPPQASGTPAYDTYQRCRRYMEQHAERLQSLQQAARQCHIDPAYLCRLFRRFDHQSPYQFLMRQKMNLAAERLQESGATIRRVAGELGFDDPYHFSRSFKQVFGISPDAFRRLR